MWAYKGLSESFDINTTITPQTWARIVDKKPCWYYFYSGKILNNVKKWIEMERKT